MTVHKIGKGKADIEAGLWGVEAKPEQFIMNQRLVDRRSDVKAMKVVYLRHAGKKPPSRRRLKESEEHFRQKKHLKAEFKKLVGQVYDEILKESFSCPIPLRKARSYDHRSDWRYCLYQGIIYQFNRPGYGSDEMIQQINDLQNQKASRPRGNS